MNTEKATQLALALGDECVEFDVQIRRAEPTGRQYTDGKSTWIEVVLEHTVEGGRQIDKCWLDGVKVDGLFLTFDTIQDVLAQAS